jgi:hypothetical protein
MPTLNRVASSIIKEQALVIGPLAWSEAQKVTGFSSVDPQSGTVTMGSGDPKIAVDQLVARYERLFGQASHEVCRDAARSLLATLQPAEVPSSLR